MCLFQLHFSQGVSPIVELLGHCSHEIKRHLLLGRKVIINLDSILKSRDITLPTKVHIVKAMVFAVVMYGCEKWTIKGTHVNPWLIHVNVWQKPLQYCKVISF